MRHSAVLMLASLIAVSFVDAPAMAAQGPGGTVGTATPFWQWLSVLCGIGLATLGVLFSRWDDGTYGDF